MSEIYVKKSGNYTLDSRGPRCVKWTRKAFMQRLLSRIPVTDSIFYFGQRYFGTFKQPFVLNRGLEIIDYLLRLGVRIENSCVVEIGTGWNLFIPLIFWLYGHKECHTYDVARLLRPSSVMETVSFLRTIYQGDEGILLKTAKEPPERRKESFLKFVQKKARAYDILEECNIYYHAPVDVSALALASESVDIVFSHTVLEHVPFSEIDGIFTEIYRILKPGGYMVHFIDASDHFSHSDYSITQINFLKFSEKSFSKYNCRFLFQNRIRTPVWRRIVLDHGFKIKFWKDGIDQVSKDCFKSLQIDESFKEFSQDELCTTSILVAAQKV